MYWQYPKEIGPDFVVLQGNSGHSKQSATPLRKAQVAMAHILFSLGLQPVSPLGQVPFVILGHFSQAIPQIPIFILILLELKPVSHENLSTWSFSVIDCWF